MYITSERSQSEKSTYSMNSTIWQFEIDKTIETIKTSCLPRIPREGGMKWIAWIHILQDGDTILYKTNDGYMLLHIFSKPLELYNMKKETFIDYS